MALRFTLTIISPLNTLQERSIAATALPARLNPFTSCHALNRERFARESDVAFRAVAF